MNDKPQTIGELRTLLDALQNSWSDEDQYYFGFLEDQTLHVALPDNGVAPAHFQYHAEFGLVAFPEIWRNKL